MDLRNIILTLARTPHLDQTTLEKIKRRFARRQSGGCADNVALLSAYRQMVKARGISSHPTLERLFRLRPVRSLSGVAVISVLTKPYRCPGRCLFCPTEKGVPKSYSPHEPAVMRAILCKYDPYRQVQARLQALQRTGHDTSKCELIVIGATFLAYPKKYQNWFIKRCFDGFNGRNYSTLLASQKANERATHRCIGLSIETRPDTIDDAAVAHLRALGVTRVELGVQHIDDTILRLNRRGHTVIRTAQATQMLKDAGFKICYHLMPGLLGSSIARDKIMFRQIFSDPDFQPDLLKIYPCVVTKSAPLYRRWKRRRYQPLTARALTNLLFAVKKEVPRYVRLARLIRDIPAFEIVSGNKVSNLRQVVQRAMAVRRVKCRCIRCREARIKPVRLSQVKMFIEEYEASSGTEFFITYESPDRQTLFAFLRLRLPTQTVLPELTECALIRELHTYGEVVPVGYQSKKAAQHLGLGRKLMAAAEKIAQQHGFPKMAVISGIGVRQYYRKLGYKRQGTYLIKKLALNRTVLYASGPVIIRRKRVALIRDANDPFWKFPGGGVKSGETWVETAQRECREEIGLSASLYGEPVILRICQPKRFIVLIHYLASVKSPRFKPGADIIAARWFPINHLPQRCAPNIKPSLERLIQNNVKFTCASKRKA